MTDDYPKDWKLRSKFVRLYRAKNRCEWCGAENYQPHPVTGSKVILMTAHVYDMDKSNGGLLNLAALCQKCHTTFDGAYKLCGGNIKPLDMDRFHIPSLPLFQRIGVDMDTGVVRTPREKYRMAKRRGGKTFVEKQNAILRSVGAMR